MRKLFFGMVLAASASAAPAAVTQVADFSGNYATTPAAGWSYQWNPTGVALGNSAGYTALSYNSTDSKYETSATGALPQANPGGYLSINATGVQMGQNASASDGNVHYAIIGYTFTAAQIAADGSSMVFHTYDFSVPSDQTLSPVSIQLMQNNTLLGPAFQFPAGTTFSNAIYGPDYYITDVAPGDTFYIAFGEPGNYSGQTVGVAFTLGLEPSVLPEPASLGLLGIAPLALRRRRR